MITLNLARKRPWTIVIPKVYRYMDQKYIDEFFETGILRLSTFHTFAQHKDEQRHDPKEGFNILFGLGDNSTIVAVTRHGSNSLIFCTSTIEDDQLMQSFNTNGYFKINKSIDFAVAIAEKIPGCKGGLQGPCIYADRRSIERRFSEPDEIVARLQEEGKKPELQETLATASRIGGSDTFFTKLKKFKSQIEYRFIWHVPEAKDPVFVECPEALEFCEKVT